MQGQQTTDAMVKELGTRFKGYRIEYPLTQQELAEKAGVSVRSIRRFETGGDIQLRNLLKLLVAMELDENLELLIPDQTKRPSYELPNEKRRLRARTKNEARDIIFRWGDET